MEKRVVITGANGFIGAKLSREHIDNGDIVYCLIQKGSNFVLDKAYIIEFDLEHPFDIVEQLPKDIDIFYHLAWVGVSTTYKNDFEVQSKNIKYSLECLRLAQELNSKKVIYTGSVSEYAYDKEPVNGKNKPCPSDMYSACKSSIRIICDLYAKQNNIDFIWVLITSIYGPGRVDNNIITYSIKAFLNKERPQYTMLEQLWDYIYIDDLIRALVCVGYRGKAGSAYAIGSGQVMQLKQYITILKDSINPELSMGIGEVPYKTKNVDNSIVDITELQRDTGFKADIDFYEGIKRTIAYFKEQGE